MQVQKVVLIERLASSKPNPLRPFFETREKENQRIMNVSSFSFVLLVGVLSTLLMSAAVVSGQDAGACAACDACTP